MSFDSPLTVASSPLLPAQQLVERLRADQPIRRVGLLQLAPRWIGQEPNFAAQLAFCGLTPFDYAAYLRSQLSPSARFVGLSREKLLDHLGALTRRSGAEEVSEEVAPPALGLGAALLLWNFDLALCLLSGEGRTEFWHALGSDAFPRGGRALLLVLPAQSPVGPDEALLEAWKESGRLAQLD